VATQTGVQCVFQLLHEPVDRKEKYNDITEEHILSSVFIPVIFVVIMRNIGVTY